MKLEGIMGSVKRERKARELLKSRLKSIEGNNISDLIEDSLTDPLDALDDAMEAIDDLFTDDSGSPSMLYRTHHVGERPDPPRGHYAGGGASSGGAPSGGTSSGASVRHAAAMKRHAAAMKRHDDNMKRHDARMKQMQDRVRGIKAPKAPKTSLSNHGGSRITVGDNNNHRYTKRLYEPNTDAETIITFRDENNYTIETNVGCSIDTKLIQKRIREFLAGEEKTIADIQRLAGITPDEPKMPENTTFKEYEVTKENDIADVLTNMAEHEHFMSSEGTPLFYHRTFFGGKGEPIEFTKESTVTVSGFNIFRRKYEVKIDGNTIYNPDMEKHLAYCHHDDRLDLFVGMRSEREKEMLRKIMEGLIALKIAEPYHIEIKELL